MKRNLKIAEQLQQVVLDYEKFKTTDEKSALEKADDLYHKLLSEGTIKRKEYNLLTNEKAFTYSFKFNGYM